MRKTHTKIVYFCHLGNGMMRASERTGGDERIVLVQFAGNGMYLGRFQTFGERKRWQNAGKPFGHHGFPATGRTDHNKNM